VVFVFVIGEFGMVIGRQAPARRLAYAVALLVALISVWGSPLPALAQLPGSLVVTITSPTSGASWIGFRGPMAGIARVFVDGVVVAEVDTFSSTDEAQVVLFTATGLVDASHTLTIEVTGLKNPASTGTFVVVDAFDVTF